MQNTNYMKIENKNILIVSMIAFFSLLTGFFIDQIFHKNLLIEHLNISIGIIIGAIFYRLVDNKEKEIKILNNFCCKNCNESSEAKLIKTYSFFHFFFLPLFKWNEKYYVICNGCNSIFNIDKEKGKAIERGEKSEISYWDLKEVNNSYENYYIRK